MARPRLPRPVCARPGCTERVKELGRIYCCRACASACHSDMLRGHTRTARQAVQAAALARTTTLSGRVIAARVGSDSPTVRAAIREVRRGQS